MSRRFLRSLRVATLALLLACEMVSAQPPQEAMGHYLRGDYAAALPGLRAGAEQGDAESQYLLGYLYNMGLGLPQDDRLSVFWSRKAAEQGHAMAQYNLGLMYAKGRGVRQDDRLARFWYTKSAEQGYYRAQVNLGFIYANGTGVPKDERRALFWYTKAAEQGSDVGQFNLGLMYANGRGVPKDDKQAYFWWILASASGNESARDYRDHIAEELTPQQRADAQTAAKDWRPTAPAPNEHLESTRGAPEDVRDPTRTGTAFRISRDRFVTNHHVIEDCRRVTVDGAAAQVGAADPRMDLALLSAPVSGATATLRTRRPQIGEAVTVAGFPLHGLLFGFQVTAGTLASLSGVGGDTSRFQITAPVQPGNSGGPVLDASGRVMGVVVSKLDAIRTAQVTGDIPQNVNFAVGGNALRAFLDANDVNYQTSEVERPLPTTTVAQQAQGFTLRVECWK